MPVWWYVITWVIIFIPAYGAMWGLNWCWDRLMDRWTSDEFDDCW